MNASTFARAGVAALVLCGCTDPNDFPELVPDAAAPVGNTVAPARGADGAVLADASADPAPDRPSVNDSGAADRPTSPEAPAPPAVDASPDAGASAPDGAPRDAVVLFYEARQVWASAQKNWARFAADLVAEGHTVRTHASGALDAAVLQGVDVLVLATSWAAFPEPELAAIRAFVMKGGGLFLTGLGWSWVSPEMARTLDNYPMNQVAGMFGIRFLDGYLCDPSDHDQDDCQPVLKVAAGHAIASGLGSIGGGITPSPLRAVGPNVEVVVAGDDDATDTQGNYPAGQHPPLVLAASFGAGRVVALGHEGYLASDDNDSDGTANLDEYDNRRLGRNIIQHLAGYR
jgi:hypothetical protein